MLMIWFRDKCWHFVGELATVWTMDVFSWNYGCGGFGDLGGSLNLCLDISGDFVDFVGFY